MTTSKNNKGSIKKPAIVIAAIAAIGTVAVALVGIVPSLTGDGKKDSAKPAAKDSQAVTATGSGNVAVGVQGGTGHTITVNPIDTRVGDLLDKGLPQTDHPVLDLSQPVASQIQLFAQDTVRIVGMSHPIERVWFGRDWEVFREDRDYTVWGVPGEPVTPRFESEGHIKILVSFTRYRNRPRDLRTASLSKEERERRPVEKK